MNAALSHFRPWLKYIWRRFNDDQCMRSAAALTSMSLFALVPLMTVTYAALSAIPTFQGMGDEVRDFLFDNLIPSASAEVEYYLADFSEQARNLTGIGIGFLVVTAVLMLRNIESAFNTIWRTRKNRGPIASFLLYWAVLSLGPLFIGLALGIGAYLVSMRVFVEEYDFIGVTAWLLSAAPILLSAAGFSLLYAAVPNCRVPIKHAVAGGVATAIVFNAARSLFAQAAIGSPYGAIYGAFAAFPLLLLWIFLSWNIILGGGIVVHSLTAYRHEAAERRPLLLKALGALHQLWLHQQRGESVGEMRLLDPKNPDGLGLDGDTWGRLRDLFLERRLLQIDERGRYLLARDLRKIKYWQLKEWIEREIPLEEPPSAEGGDWRSQAWGLLLEGRSRQRESMDLSLAELFEQ